VNEGSAVPEVAYCSPKGAYAVLEYGARAGVEASRELHSQSEWR